MVLFLVAAAKGASVVQYKLRQQEKRTSVIQEVGVTDSPFGEYGASHAAAATFATAPPSSTENDQFSSSVRKDVAAAVASVRSASSSSSSTATSATAPASRPVVCPTPGTSAPATTAERSIAIVTTIEAPEDSPCPRKDNTAPVKDQTHVKKPPADDGSFNYARKAVLRPKVAVAVDTTVSRGKSFTTHDEQPALVRHQRAQSVMDTGQSCRDFLPQKPPTDDGSYNHAMRRPGAPVQSSRPASAGSNALAKASTYSIPSTSGTRPVTPSAPPAASAVVPGSTGARPSATPPALSSAPVAATTSTQRRPVLSATHTRKSATAGAYADRFPGPTGSAGGSPPSAEAAQPVQQPLLSRRAASEGAVHISNPRRFNSLPVPGSFNAELMKKS